MQRSIDSHTAIRIPNVVIFLYFIIFIPCCKYRRFLDKYLDWNFHIPIAFRMPLPVWFETGDSVVLFISVSPCVFWSTFLRISICWKNICIVPKDGSTGVGYAISCLACTNLIIVIACQFFKRCIFSLFPYYWRVALLLLQVLISVSHSLIVALLTFSNPSVALYCRLARKGEGILVSILFSYCLVGRKCFGFHLFCFSPLSLLFIQLFLFGSFLGW